MISMISSSVCVCVCVHCGGVIGNCGTASLSFLSLSFSSLPDKALQLIETLTEDQLINPIMWLSN